MVEHRLYDVIIVGAGPGGTSAATFLARQGLDVLLLDKTQFPRDKVCGDGLLPQAIYWLDILGCADEVLAQTNSCITSADLYVDGERVLTGRFPKEGAYPGFCALLERKKLDEVLLRNAIASRAQFKPGHNVRLVEWLADGIAVEAESEGGTVRFVGKLLVGADGGNSVVSRAMGNVPRDGTTAVCLRTYYQNVKVDGSQFKIFFDEQFFPGYGWLFVDDSGKANIGLGYATDRIFRNKRDLKKLLAEFIESDLKGMLKEAMPIGHPAGWWACFSRARRIVADKVMLVGDAANLADPMNGGGIYKAMESGYRASEVAVQALRSGDCSKEMLGLYDRLWRERSELDWRTGELFLSLAKNPNLREFYLLCLRSLGRLSAKDRRFQDYCIDFFTEFTPRSASISPMAFLEALPLDPRAWLSIIQTPNGSTTRGTLEAALSAAIIGWRTTGRLVTNPAPNIAWGLEMLDKALGLAVRYADKELSALSV